MTHFNFSEIGFSAEDIPLKAETEIEWIGLESDLSSTVSKIPKDVGGVYILSPLTTYSSEEIKAFLIN
ncbi:MAG: hypothetical protein IPL49_07980 [Saprospirales bacterium]|nr:hypothetical protein [Saprospirales bacterium]